MRFIASLLLAAATLGFAAPVSAADFSHVFGVDAELHIVQRVSDKSIFVDIQRVQSYRVTTTDKAGAIVTRTETNDGAVLANSDVVIGICQSVQQLRSLSTEGCGVKTNGRTRQEPTAHKSN